MLKQVGERVIRVIRVERERERESSDLAAVNIRDRMIALSSERSTRMMSRFCRVSSHYIKYSSYVGTSTLKISLTPTLRTIRTTLTFCLVRSFKSRTWRRRERNHSAENANCCCSSLARRYFAFLCSRICLYIVLQYRHTHHIFLAANSSCPHSVAEA